jgi:hypothetical protein
MPWVEGNAGDGREQSGNSRWEQRERDENYCGTRRALDLLGLHSRAGCAAGFRDEDTGGVPGRVPLAFRMDGVGTRRFSAAE